MKKLLIAGLSLSLLLVGCGSKTDFNQISGQQGNVGGSPPPPPPPPPAQNPPVAVNDAFTTDENQPLTVGAPGVLVNDTVNNAAITFPTTSAQGGTVAGNQDGSFTYTPATDFNGADTFVYTLTNSTGSDSATVTITVAAVVVQGFFVDSENGDDTTGSFETGAPFATVQAAVAAAPEGADIVVRPGTYEGEVNLKNGQRLLGEGFEDVNPQGTVKPLFTGPINLADGNTVRGLRIQDSPGRGIDGSGRVDATITDCDISNTTGNGIRGDGSSGEWIIRRNTTLDTNIAIFIRTVDNDEMTLTIEDNEITNAVGAIGLLSEGNSDVVASVLANTFTNSQGVGDSFEVEAVGESQFCLDLEDNTSDGSYNFFRTATATLNIEQFDVIDVEKPAGAGNTGTAFTTGLNEPTSVDDGACSS